MARRINPFTMPYLGGMVEVQGGSTADDGGEQVDARDPVLPTAAA